MPGKWLALEELRDVEHGAAKVDITAFCGEKGKEFFKAFLPFLIKPVKNKVECSVFERLELAGIGYPEIRTDVESVEILADQLAAEAVDG